jgi:hypothetical protein
MSADRCYGSAASPNTAMTAIYWGASASCKAVEWKSKNCVDWINCSSGSVRTTANNIWPGLLPEGVCYCFAKSTPSCLIARGAITNTCASVIKDSSTGAEL